MTAAAGIIILLVFTSFGVISVESQGKMWCDCAVVHRCRYFPNRGVVCICSTGHIEWAWNRQKTWGGGGAHAPSAPLVPTPMPK